MLLSPGTHNWEVPPRFTIESPFSSFSFCPLTLTVCPLLSSAWFHLWKMLFYIFNFTSAFPDRCVNSVTLSLYEQIAVWEVILNGTPWFYSFHVAAWDSIMQWQYLCLTGRREDWGLQYCIWKVSLYMNRLIQRESFWDLNGFSLYFSLRNAKCHQVLKMWVLKPYNYIKVWN